MLDYLLKKMGHIANQKRGHKLKRKFTSWSYGNPTFYAFSGLPIPAPLNKRFFRGGRGYLKRGVI